MPLTPTCRYLDPVGTRHVCRCTHSKIDGPCSEHITSDPNVTYCGTCAYYDPGNVVHSDTDPQRAPRPSRCEYLGDDLATIPGDVADCHRCDIRVVYCNYHRQPVTIKPVRRDHQPIVAAHIADYQGHTCHRCPHRRRSRPKPPRYKRSDVTIGVTAFQRPDALQRLLDSIREHYPDLPVIVEDTQGNLSAGRNRILRQTKTELLWLMDDDFQLNRHSRLDVLLAILSHDSELAGIAGSVKEKHRIWTWCHDFDAFRGVLHCRPSTRPWRTTSDGHPYRPADCVINFFLARTAALRESPWDERLETSEHREFFWRFAQAKRWRWAWTPEVACFHHRDRPEGYSELRQRNFLPLAETTHGLQFARVEMPPARQPARPNIVVMGVGHSNTTITTRQIASLGWRLNQADHFAELDEIRQLNVKAIRSGRLDVAAAKNVVNRWQQPWIVKDPRFCNTLQRWLPVFVRNPPLLVWIDKDLDAVKASHEKRGQPADYVTDRWWRAKQQYQLWPWAKLHLQASRVRDAVAMFQL